MLGLASPRRPPAPPRPGAAAGRRHEQRAAPARPGPAHSQQLGGVLAGGAVDAPLQVTDRPRGQASPPPPAPPGSASPRPATAAAARRNSALPARSPAQHSSASRHEVLPQVRRGPTPPPALGPFPRRAAVQGRCSGRCDRQSWPCSCAAWACRLRRSRMTWISIAEFRQRVQAVMSRDRKRYTRRTPTPPIDCCLRPHHSWRTSARPGRASRVPWILMLRGSAGAALVLLLPVRLLQCILDDF